ncbi:MAG: SDR family oxidoreductase [Actinomycetota bacterium]|nr:SDR family oxidoreductase [Actinomycetota bacterium]
MSSDGATPTLPERLSMDGRHVAVTGAASGLGLAIAEGLAQCGAHITLIDRDRVGLERAAAAFEGVGGGVFTACCDISEPEAIEGVLADADGVVGRLDAVFANAGIAGGPAISAEGGHLHDLDWADVHGAVSVNLLGTLATIRAAALVMRPARRGSIVVTVSTAGLRADSMVGYGYSASKGALANLVRQAAVELAPAGIRVNGIAPGPFFTNIGGPGPIEPAVEKASVGRHGAAGPHGTAGRDRRAGPAPGVRRLVVHDRHDLPGRRRGDGRCVRPGLRTGGPGCATRTPARGSGSGGGGAGVGCVRVAQRGERSLGW